MADEQPSWERRVSVSRRHLLKIQNAIARLDFDSGIETLIHAWVKDSEHRDIFRKEYENLEGKTLSPGGLFGLLTHMTPEMIGPTEVSWLQKVRELCQRMINSITGRPLDDTTPLSTEQPNQRSDALPILRLNDVIVAIDTAFPPQGRVAAP